MDRKTFLLSKLHNFVKFLRSLNIDYHLIDKLESFYEDYQQFLILLTNLSMNADKQGNLKDKFIASFLKQYNVDFFNFEDQHRDKFKRYLECFVNTVRMK